MTVGPKKAVTALAAVIALFAAACNDSGCAPAPPPQTAPPTTKKPVVPPTTKKPVAPPTTKKPVVPPTTKKPVTPPTTSKPPSTRSGMVVVVGSGPGAVASAVAAAAEGANVTLVTHDTPVLGGQMASVGHMDSAGDDAKYGPYREFLRRSVAAAPAMNLNMQLVQKGWVPLGLTKKVLNDWLAEYDVRVVRAEMSSVQTSGQRVTGVTVGGERIPANVVIDASEWGDVLKMSGAAYRVGNGRSDKGTINNADCVQEITWPVNAGTKYNTKSTGSIVPIAPNEFGGWVVWDTLEPNTRYREVAETPGHRYSMWNHHTADMYANVGDVEGSHVPLLQRSTNQIMNYAATVQAMPGGNQWGLDTGASENKWPVSWVQNKNRTALAPLPYIREARRGVGVQTLNSSMMKRVEVPGRARYRDATQDANAIAVGNYASDLHGCPGATDPEEPVVSDIQDGRSSPYRTGPFSVPNGTIIPKTMNGLVFAEKNMSTTRAVGGAVRLHPIAFSTGAAAGTTAGLATVRNVHPRNINVLDVQWRVANTWGADLTIEPWTDTRPVTREQAFVEVSVARGWWKSTSDSAQHQDSIKRGDAVVILAQAKGLTPITNNVFSDVTGQQGKWLAAANADGWFDGCSAGKSCAGKTITRLELAYIGNALMGSKAGPLPADMTGAAAKVAASSIARNEIAWWGASRNFKPNNEAVRLSVYRLGGGLLEARTR